MNTNDKNLKEDELNNVNGGIHIVVIRTDALCPECNHLFARGINGDQARLLETLVLNCPNCGKNVKAKIVTVEE